jgi:hypothetical protein
MVKYLPAASLDEIFAALSDPNIVFSYRPSS